MVRRIEPENDRHDRGTQHDPRHKPGKQEWHAENSRLDPIDEKRADQHGGERQKRKHADHANQIARWPPVVLFFGALLLRRAEQLIGVAMRKFFQIAGRQLERINEFPSGPVGAVGIIDREQHAVRAEDRK